MKLVKLMRSVLPGSYCWQCIDVDDDDDDDEDCRTDFVLAEDTRSFGKSRPYEAT